MAKKGLSGVNTKSGIERELERLGRNPQSYADYRYNQVLATPQRREIGNYAPDELGESKYDDAIRNATDFQNLEEVRFNEQSTAAAMGNAAVKLLGTAGTTLVSGIGGLLVGVPTAIAEGRWSGLWDNELTEALSDIDNKFEKNFKIYQSEKQREAKWYDLDSLTSAGFWGDSVIKNIGFTIGAAYSGGAFTKVLGLTARAFNVAQQASKATRYTTGILGSLFSAAGEGAIEAKHTAAEITELETQRLQDTIGEELTAAKAKYEANKGTLINVDGNIIDPAYEEYKAKEKELGDRFEAGKAQIEKDARSAGNLTMALNIPILTIGNFITLGKGFSKSFNDAANVSRNTSRASGENLIKGVSNLTDRIKRATTSAIREPEKAIEDAIEYGVKDNINARRFLAAVKPIISEGSEEMNQGWASSFAGYYKAHREDPNDYWRAKLNPGSEQELLSGMEALSKGFGDSWGNWDKWEEFAVGGLTGAMGVPMATKVFNQDKTKSKYNPARYFSWEGGIFQNLREFNRELDAATKSVSALNKRVNSPKFWQRMQNGVAHVNFQATMDDAAKNGEIKEYKDAEEKQFVQDLEAFARAGKLDDFKEIIKHATQDLSDEDIENLINRSVRKVSAEENAENQRRVLREEIDKYKKILDNSSNIKKRNKKNIEKKIKKLEDKLTKVKGKETTISQYTDSNGNLLKPINDIKKDFAENGKKLLERVDEYSKILGHLDNVTNGQLTEDQLGNLAYLEYMSKAQIKRSDKLFDTSGSVLPQEFTINTKESVEQLNKKYGNSSIEFYKDKDNNTKVKITDNYKSSESRDFLTNFLLRRGEDEFNSIWNQIVDSLNYNSAQGLDTYIKSLTDITDAIKLRMDASEFAITLADYLKNPSKVDEAKEKAEKEREKEITDSIIDNKDTKGVADAIENGEIDGEISSEDNDELASMFGDSTGSNALDEIDEADKERQKKLKDAKELSEARRKAEAKVEQLPPEVKEDAKELLNKSKEKAQSKEELLDLESEAFNDSDNLSTTEGEQEELAQMFSKGASQEELNKAIAERKQQRLDAAKEALQEVKQELEDEEKLLENLPKEEKPKIPSDEDIEQAKPVKKFDISRDPVSSTHSVNGKANNDQSSKTEDASPKISDEEEIPEKEDEREGGDIATPMINDSNKLETSPHVDNIETKGYWKSNTTEVPIHREQGNQPYYTLQKEGTVQRGLYKALYDYLKDMGAFNRIKNNEIKLGQKVRFAISTTLQQTIQKETGRNGITVLLIVDENNNILGDLINTFENRILSSNPGLYTLYQEAIKGYNENKDNLTGDLFIVPNAESEIRHILVGRPLYAGNRKSLNDIAGNQNFTLGIAVDDNTVLLEPGRRKIQGKTQKEATAMSPVSYKPGQPFLMIETADPRRRYYPVPITMPTFSKNSNNTRLHRLVVEHISKLDEIFKSGDTSKINAWKDTFKDLLGVDGVYVDIKTKKTLTPDGVRETKTLVFRIKRLKTDTAWQNIAKGETFDVDGAINTLYRFNIPFQVSRKYVNGTFNGESYNRLIGELASTNLEDGALHTVNDFFTINPIIDGKMQKAERPKSVDTNSVKNNANKAKASRANEVVRTVIMPAQELVDKSRTDSEYYYIKEDDGKYHKYERVHKVLPNNFKGSSKHGDRALVTGTAVDSIIRQYFDPSVDRNKIEKPYMMTQAAFNSLIKWLGEFDSRLKKSGWTVHANNLVLYHKYPDGRRVAGEVDLLLVDDKGNFHIFDVKTSAYSFSGSNSRFSQTMSYQEMSTKDFYTLQLSAYKKLLYDQFGIKTDKIGLIPFVVGYSDNNQGNDVVGIRSETVIQLTPNPKIDNYFNQNSKTNESETIKGTTSTEKIEENKNKKEEDKKEKEKEKVEDTSQPKLSTDSIKEKLKSTKLFNKPNLKEALDKLDDDVLEALSKMPVPALRTALNRKGIKINKRMSKEELNNFVRTEILKGTLLRKVEDIDTPSETERNLDKELKVIGKILPQLNEEERLVIVKSILNTPEGKAWGQFKNGIITMYNKAARGTAYHEAFHFVFNTLLSYEEMEKAYESAKNKYGDLEYVALEEKMAEEFREYMQNEETFTGRLKNLWGKLKNILNKFRGREHYLDNLYFQVSRGNFKNRSINEGINRDTNRNTNNNEKRVTLSKLHEYQRKKYRYKNLNEEDKRYIKEVGISIKEYNNMTPEQKEILFRCKY